MSDERLFTTCCAPRRRPGRSTSRSSTGDTALTYGELDARSNQVASLLRDLGVRRGDRVGLYLEKSLDALVGIYGMLKAGAAYVPFDPQAPPTRLAYIARNAGLEVVISGAAKAGSWGRCSARRPESRPSSSSTRPPASSKRLTAARAWSAWTLSTRSRVT